MDVRITGLSVSYGGNLAVDDLDLTVHDGESLVLLGASGCGKSTTMRSVAGLEKPVAGTIAIGGRTVFDAGQKIDVAANHRGVGMVFQSYAVWPHRTVLENVTFPLRMRRIAKRDQRTKALEVLDLVGLAHLADRGASMLSGGQMQRVALARSLAMEPAVLLLDEPLSNLDARLRDGLRIELRRIQQELGLTCVYVTHDQAEALALADRIAVMEGGRIQQLAAPQEIYSAPGTASIASFMGVTNVFPVAAGSSGGSRVRLADHDLALNVAAPVPQGSTASVCIRPESVELSAEPAGRRNSWKGRVEVLSFQGSSVRYSVRLDDGPLLDVVGAAATNPVSAAHDPVHVSIAPESVLVLPNGGTTA